MRSATARFFLMGAVFWAVSAAHGGFIVVDEPPPPSPPAPPAPEARRVNPHFSFAPLEVTYHRVQVEIDGQVATVRVDQEFYNPNPRALEGTYMFPLPEGARINHFAMDVEGTMTPAELLPADKARAIYEDIVRRQRDPALLEYVGRDALKARIFPLEPRKGKRIQIEYVQLLQADGGLLEFVYPLSTEKFSSRPLKEVAIQVAFQSDIPIRNVYSPSHTVEIIRDGERRMSAGYEAAQVRADADFRVIAIRDEEPGALRALFHREGDEGYFMLLASAPAPSADEGPLAKDICFVLDTSGSMSGGKLDQAKRALRFCLDNLNDGDRFEVIRFSSDTESLFDGLRPVSAASRAEAIRFVEAFRPIGGTAIAAALQQAMEAGRARTAPEGGAAPPYLVIFLTDGQPTVGETGAEKLAAIPVSGVGGGGGPVRVFSFGIGHDVNTHFLDMVAKNTNAASQYVAPNEDLELKLSYFYSRIQDPALTGLALSVEAEGVRLSETWPPSLPDMYRHDTLAIFGRYALPGRVGVPGDVAIAGMAGGTPATMRVNTVFPAVEAGHAFIPRLWATRRVAWLLDEVRLRGESAELRDEITRLARQYGIVTPFTSYLILEDEARRNVPAARQALRDMREDRQAAENARAEFSGLAAAGRGEEAARAGGAAVERARSVQFYSTSNLQMMRSASAPAAASAGNRTLADAENRALADADAASRLSAAPAMLERPAAAGQAAPFAPGGAGGSLDPRASAQQLAERRANMGYREEQQANYATQARFVNNRAFYQNDQRWIDIGVQAREDWPTEDVPFASDAYFALLERHPEARPWLAMGDDMDIVLAGRLYQIRP